LYITDGTTRIGSVTSGSAVVYLSSSFLDGLTNGNYAIELGFADTYTLRGAETFSAQGVGTSELVITRDDTPTEPTDPTDPDDGDDGDDGDDPGDGDGDGNDGGGTPQTGDSLQPILLAILLTAVGILCLVIWRGTRRTRQQR
jgi:hypothetical protein